MVMIKACNMDFTVVRPLLFSSTVRGRTGLGQYRTSDHSRSRSPRKAEDAKLVETPADAVAEEEKEDSKANRRGKSRRRRKPNRMKFIFNLVKDKLGRELNESDIAYTIYAPEEGNEKEGFVAKVTLKCFEGKPSHLGEMKNNRTEALRSAVEVVLCDQALQAAPNKKKMSAAPTKKTIRATPTTKRIPAANANGTFQIADLDIGQELRGVVTGKNSGGVYVNVGAETNGYLRAQELEDEGIPRRIPKIGEEMSVRVLSKNETYIWLTRRSGELERPPMVDHLDLTAASFKDLRTTEWFDAEVVGMTLSGVILRATHPEGGEPASAYLDRLNFADDFGKKAKLGDKVRVRKKRVQHDVKNQRDFLFVSMKEEVDLESINVGDSVNGTIARVAARGVFVDVGTNIDAFLSDEESYRGFPFRQPIVGDTVTARVLGKDSKMLNLTRKSGDLARPRLVFDSQADLSPFVALSSNEWFDGQVIHMRRPFSIVVALQLPGTTAYTTGLLPTREAPLNFLKEVSVGMATKVRIKKVTTEPRLLLLTMKELASNSDGTQGNNEVEETTSTSESSQSPSTEAVIEEAASTFESSQNPLTEATIEELVPVSESPQKPSTEGAPREAAEVEAPKKKGHPFEDIQSVLLR
eukprot:CAMPEP_0172679982 /NCGR_PEP_ID=MMETSP1074-20121228/16437_1 /TAXON_ID=2916 /ORGANISM="Ceratium fusus, Strain PA161109" /LENGTH=638 /DNA_ID=CAMNT_0013498231 /DNA_START=66 /DNA_END=1982 /DNA_ORIENTATION=+